MKIFNPLVEYRSYFDFSKKVRTDLIWSIISFFIIGISGISLTFLTARFYSTATLGLLNTVLIIYTIYSQFANFGIHFAVIKYVSEFINNEEVLTSILRSSLLATLIVSTAFTVLFYFMVETISGLFMIDNIEYALYIICPSIILFTLNKVLLSFYNGIRSIKLYSIFFAFRFFFWVVLLLLFVGMNFEGKKLSYIFLISESALFVILFISIFGFVIRKSSSSSKEWFWRILSFGLKSVFGSIFADFNTRIDVLILGMFQSASVVGIYSFATLFIDGFNQLGIVFRISMNPIITNTFVKSGAIILKEKIKKVRNVVYLILFIFIFSTLIIYPYIIDLFSLKPDYHNSFLPLVILSFGLSLSSGYLPFHMIFNQTGFPIYQTLFYLIVFVTNIILNISFIYFYGILGCAIATSLNYLLTPVIINLLNKRTLGFVF